MVSFFTTIQPDLSQFGVLMYQYTYVQKEYQIYGTKFIDQNLSFAQEG